MWQWGSWVQWSALLFCGSVYKARWSVVGLLLCCRRQYKVCGLNKMEDRYFREWNTAQWLWFRHCGICILNIFEPISASLKKKQIFSSLKLIMSNFSWIMTHLFSNNDLVPQSNDKFSQNNDWVPPIILNQVWVKRYSVSILRWVNFFEIFSIFLRY